MSTRHRITAALATLAAATAVSLAATGTAAAAQDDYIDDNSIIGSIGYADDDVDDNVAITTNVDVQVNTAFISTVGPDFSDSGGAGSAWQVDW